MKQQCQLSRAREVVLFKSMYVCMYMLWVCANVSVLLCVPASFLNRWGKTPDGSRDLRRVDPAVAGRWRAILLFSVESRVSKTTADNGRI